MERIRKIDINQLPEEQVQQIETELKKKVSEMVNSTVKDLNKLLNVYGLEAVLGIRISKQGEANLIDEEGF